MLNTIACAFSLLALVSNQTDKLKITNARFTYGHLGMIRTDSKCIPGDELFLVYDIENASVDKKTGKVVYTMVLELLDTKGELVQKRENTVEVLNALGSTRQPSFVTVTAGASQKPGIYKVKLSVTDKVAKKKTSITKEFEILKKSFGFIRVEAPVVSFLGSPFPIRFTVVGFKKDGKNIPKVSVKLTILDEDGKGTLVKPVAMEIPKDLPAEIRPEDLTYLPFPVSFVLNKAGKFTVKLEARDHVGKVNKKLEYKITVLDPRKYESGK